MKTIRVRKADKNDADEIFKLWKELAKDHTFKAKGIKLDDMIVENPYYELLSDKNNLVIFIAEIVENNINIAFIEMYIKEPDCDFDKDKYAYVLHCYIDEKYRNTNTIFLLLDACNNYLKKNEIKYMFADVFYHNSKFYKNIQLLEFTPFKTRFMRKVYD